MKKNIHSNALSGSAAAILEIRCNPKCSSSGCGVPHKARQSEADCPLKQMHSSQLNGKGSVWWCWMELKAQAVSLHWRWLLETSCIWWKKCLCALGLGLEFKGQSPLLPFHSTLTSSLTSLHVCYGSLLFLALGMETNECQFPVGPDGWDCEQFCKILTPLLCVTEKCCLCTAVKTIW